MVAINHTSTLPKNAELAGNVVTDFADNADMTNGPAYFGRTRLVGLMRAAGRLGMLYHSAGTPTGKPTAAGAMCIDTTNNKVYVCTKRAATPTWTALSEA